VVDVRLRTRKIKGEKMSVTIVKGGETYTMGYDPCHFEGIKSFYEEALANGEIESYTIDV
jgi:hypothetical protein